MKYLLPLAALCLLFTITSCSDEENPEFCSGSDKVTDYDFTSSLQVQDSFQTVSYTISFPDCFEHVIKQGIDTQVGDFTSVDDNITFSYDIGFLAGVYVDENDKTVDASQDYVIWYNQIDSIYYFSFPELSVNFFAIDDRIDEMLEIMKTVRKN